RRLDGAAIVQQSAVVAESRPRPEMRRHADIGRWAKHHGPRGGEPGIHALPKRRTCRQGEQMGQVRSEQADDADRLVAARNADMDMQSENVFLVSKPALLTPNAAKTLPGSDGALGWS